MIINSGRGGQIRTDDFLLPKQALYQAELRPATRGPLANPDTKSRTSYPNFQISGICPEWTKLQGASASSWSVYFDPSAALILTQVGEVPPVLIEIGLPISRFLNTPAT